jgi:hypothetical protein
MAVDYALHVIMMKGFSYEDVEEIGDVIRNGPWLGAQVAEQVPARHALIGVRGQRPDRSAGCRR